MTNPPFEDLAAAIRSYAEGCQADLVELKRTTPDLRPLLDAGDAHRWVHVVHTTQVVGCASAAARLLQEANETEPLVFAALVRPAWEAAVQLDWIHTNATELTLRWFDYAYFKAVLDHRGGKSRLVQEDLLFELSSPSRSDPDYELLRQLCSRHMSNEELTEATAGIELLLAEERADYPTWSAVGDDEWDAFITESEIRGEHIATLRPLRDFLRIVRLRTGWSYPQSWTTAQVRGMVRDLHVASPSPYSSTDTAYPSWPYVWDPDGRREATKYREYQRLSETAHSAGPGVLYTFGTAWSQYRASAQFIRSAAELMLDVLRATGRSSWECPDQG